jgi:hypothetical protein
MRAVNPTPYKVEVSEDLYRSCMTFGCRRPRFLKSVSGSAGEESDRRLTAWHRTDATGQREANIDSKKGRAVSDPACAAS